MYTTEIDAVLNSSVSRGVDLLMFTDTIFALSSGRLPSGVAIIRLSGPHVRQCLIAMLGAPPEPRRAKLSFIRTQDGGVIDQGLALFFPAPASFTGEDCAELHLHGGLATVSACLAALGSFSGMRMAEPGEFTRRAFLMGKVDLTEAEGLADLVSAETEAQRLQALANARGGQKNLYEAWRQRIIHARAMIEAEIDFADEGDVPGSVAAQIWADMEALKAEMGLHLSRARGGEIVRNGLDVVILGAPNAGKSSLLNALAGRDVSIVTEEAGTTRDLVEARLDIGGFRVNLVDTAGIREKAGRIETLGIEKALERSAGCDLVLLVEDVAAPASSPELPTNVPVLRVGLKGDLLSGPARKKYDVITSTLTSAGFDELCRLIVRFAAEARGNIGEAIPVRQRQVELLSLSVAHLENALRLVAMGIEIRAEELRLAGESLGKVTGRIDVEDLLDVVFSQFCIGK
jgi:tRNA modification GTPase